MRATEQDYYAIRVREAGIQLSDDQISDIEERVLRTIGTTLARSKGKTAYELSQLTPKAKLTQDLGADSLNIPEIVIELEDEFDIPIDDEELSELLLVEDVVLHCCRKVANLQPN